ncbi:MAG: transglutaminase domain-containing protein [Lachnospiraceae bacterium]|nr:transglutaminase domain-containing protein [Lachnospiraceae bacterium]
MRKHISKSLLFALYRWISCFLLTGALVGCVGNYMGIWQIKGIHLLLMAIWIALLTWGNYGKKSERLIAFTALGAVVLVIIPILAGCFAGELLETYGKWLLGEPGYREDLLLGYELLQISWITLLCYMLTLLTERSLLIKSVCGSALLGLLLMQLFWGFDLQKYAVSFLLAYVLVLCTEILQKYWNKQKQGDAREYSLFLMPFFVGYILLLLCMPNSENPYDWKLFREIYANVSENITIMMESIIRDGQEDFGNAFSGFSEDGKLVPGISNRSKEILKIEGGRGLYTNVYLTGKIYDTFDGMEWTKQAKEEIDPALDVLELAYAVRNYDSELMSNYFLRNRIKVSYKYFHTKYLFAPLKWMSVSDNRKILSGEELYFDKKVGYGTTYDVTYYQLNLNASCFQDLLRTHVKENPDNWEYARYQFGNTDWPHYTLEDLNVHRDKIKKNYAEDVALSEEVDTQLKQLFLDCETDYDKMKTLEAYLSSLEYTSNPGKIPQWVKSQEDFMDYFWMEGKKGYCAYFATAFVLAARSQGLPARYVEGFCVPLTKDKSMVVTTQMTHAWPEVYFEGVGWIPFEPTPGYGNLRYSGWKMKESKQDSQIDYGEITPPSFYQEEELPPKPVIQEEKDEWDLGIVLWWTFLAVGLCVLCIAVLLGEKLVQRYYHSRLPLSRQFEIYVKRLLWIWSRLGYQRKEEETLQELQDRIRENEAEVITGQDKLQSLRKAEFLQMYQDYLYGDLCVTKEQVAKLKEEERNLLGYLKKHRRWLFVFTWLRM